MAMTETARLERETEETRAQLESTLFELRARMSPGSLMDQATGYLRGSSGRAFLGNLRHQVVDNPLPVTLIGAGIAWLAIAGAIGRRSNGNGHADVGRDWSETSATAYGMAHDGGRRPGMAERARRTAEGWIDEAQSAASEAGETVRQGMDDLRERAGTIYDETRSATSDAGDTLRRRAGEMRERAAGMYDETARGTRRMARRAADYGRAARHAVRSDGVLMNFCREQPMLVAGLGIAVGAALGALIPASRAETRIMGDASQEVQDRAREVAAEGLRAAANSSGEGDERTREAQASDARSGDARSGDAQAGGKQASDDAAAEVDRGVQEASNRPNVENEPQTAAPYAESAEAGAATAPGEAEAKRRS
jgi:ElaB/YqjD/DUF883 family membrane-anchored ribosome-binding protein